ncbi:hypothetical protein Tco_1478636 [Tanacetum coccineum]
MELYLAVNVDKLKLFKPSMLNDELGESLPSVNDLVTEQDAVLQKILLLNARRAPPVVVKGNRIASGRKGSAQVRLNGFPRKLEKPNFIIYNFRTRACCSSSSGKGRSDPGQSQASKSTCVNNR